MRDIGVDGVTNMASAGVIIARAQVAAAGLNPDSDVNNPEAAVRIVYETFPQTKPTGKDEATAVRDDVKVLEARIPHWLLEPAG
jgi:hypothetical protein